MSHTQMTGGWSEPRPLTHQDMRIFNEALRGLTGAIYTPHLVSTQVVNGTNYIFLCSTRSATNRAIIGFAVVSAHRSLHGRVRLTDIKRCGTTNSGGRRERIGRLLFGSSW